MADIRFTLLVFHAVISALKLVAPKNIFLISIVITEESLPIPPPEVHGIATLALLNAVAVLNILKKVVTLRTFQPPMSWLNELTPSLFANIRDILVTKEVSQEPMA